MIAFIRRLFSRYGFHRQPAPQKRDDWQAHPFYPNAGDKARRLAEIARQRNALKDELAKAMRQKKATAPMYHALRALKVEELKVEGRR
jgi:hypothetical protein